MPGQLLEVSVAPLTSSHGAVSRTRLERVNVPMNVADSQTPLPKKLSVNGVWSANRSGPADTPACDGPRRSKGFLKRSPRSSLCLKVIFHKSYSLI